MADISIYAPKLIRFEGGYVNNPNDSGGCTKYGITLATAQQYGLDKNGDGVIDCSDVQLLDENDFQTVLKGGYWDKWLADQINNQSIAELLVDWFYNSGHPGITIPQGIVGVTQDGQVGPATIAAVNGADPQTLFGQVWNARQSFFKNIAANNPKDEVFLNGWLNRLNQFSFSA
jgi:lysozyme family protein